MTKPTNSWLLKGDLLLGIKKMGSIPPFYSFKGNKVELTPVDNCFETVEGKKSKIY